MPILPPYDNGLRCATSLRVMPSRIYSILEHFVHTAKHLVDWQPSKQPLIVLDDRIYCTHTEWVSHAPYGLLDLWCAAVMSERMMLLCAWMMMSTSCWYTWGTALVHTYIHGCWEHIIVQVNGTQMVWHGAVKAGISIQLCIKWWDFRWWISRIGQSHFDWRTTLQQQL